MEDFNKIVNENTEGTVIPLEHKDQLKEQYETLQVKHLAALEANNEDEAKEIEGEMNKISEELGWDEEKLAA